ncbi:lycopene cyclase domain-containing protein [Cerasicoccus maritimus]|uniref:lycopene cyclase domain-containing protein n=1 Tax=Cerasicoccus maritimus TaxID=490089 RepID=UPI0028529918|nr:lycopene cyclase domain-containing protein [Cerasicoccus maritimus]
MNIYADWLPDNAYYAFHLLAWLGGVVALQWLGFHRLLWANRRAIFLPAVILGTYLILTDIVAVHFEIWHFDPNFILAGSVESPIARFLLKPFGVPIEEWLFFYLTAQLVSQSFILFLPKHLRKEPKTRQGNN